MLPEPTHYDNSRLADYAHCPKHYYNRYVLGLEEPRGLNTRFSTHMIHDPITEWYFRGRDWRLTDEQWQERLDKVRITQAEAAIKANSVYSIASAKRCFEQYATQFDSDHDRFTILGAENYIVDPVLGFGSKPDVRAQEKATGLLWTIELKFSGWDFILEGSTMNPQFLGQVNNTKGHGCIVTLIQPSGSTWSRFTVVREEIVPTAQELEEWRKEKAFEMETVRRSYATGVWPKNTPHACTQYGGCFFVGLCVAGHPPEMVKRMPKEGDVLSYLSGGFSHDSMA